LRFKGRSIRDGGTVRSAVVLAMWLAMCVTACGPGADRVGPGRDVVLIVIDTLRWDFVGVSGNAPHPATPEIDRLARRGRWFAEAWASAPWTPPSVMSLMTSLEPPVHGLNLEADRLAEAVPGLPSGASTLAEILKANGYRTMAVTAGGGVGSVYGFDRGFDRYFEPKRRPQSDVESGVDRALAFLAEPDPRPTFLFFHTYEVHLPNTHPALGSSNDPASRARAAYAGDLAVADQHLGRLFAALEGDGRLERALVVVTADHGENLHDRVLGGRPVDHGHHLHAELLRVPLILVAPGLIPPDGEIAEPAQLLDVLPTVCSLVGIGLENTPHQGRDLRPMLQGWGSVEPRHPLYFWAPLQGPSWGAVRSAEWTYIRAPGIETEQWWGTVSLPARTLNDRTADPGEWIDLAGTDPGIVSRMETTLRRREEDDLELRRALGVPGIVESSSTEALRELGYLDREPSDGE